MLNVRELDAKTQMALTGKVQVPIEKYSASQEARDLLAFQIRATKLPEPKVEFLFASELRRRWLFDFAWPAQKVAFEVEGLVVKKVGKEFAVKGRHATIDGMRGDMVKYNHAGLLGWLVLRAEQSMIKNGEAIDMLQRVLSMKGWRR